MRKIVLLIAVSILLIPLIAQADALISTDIAKGATQFFTAKDCATACQKTISGTPVKITQVDINFDKKAEYRVALTDCGSAGCPAAIFMYREGAWIKLIEGLGMHVLRSKTKGFADLGSSRDKFLWNGRNYEWHEG